MGSRPLRCRLGRHAWVQIRAPHGMPRGPDRWVCSECRKVRTASIPLGLLGG